MFGLLKTLVFGGDEDKEDSVREKKDYTFNQRENRSFTGCVTSVEGRCGMVDYNVFFDQDAVVGGEKPSEGDTVHVEAVREHSEAGWRAVSIQLVEQWRTGAREEALLRSVVGYVKEGGRGRWMAVCGKEEVLFDGTAVDPTYLPHRGDWVMVGLKGDSEEVTSVRPLREKTITGRVERFTGVQGIVDGNIGFSLAVCESGYYPRVGDEVRVTSVECEHAHLSWRAVSMSFAPSEKVISPISQVPSIQSSSPAEVPVQERNGVVLNSLLDFGDVEVGKLYHLPLTVSNTGSTDHQLVSCHPVTYTDQITIVPPLPSGDDEAAAPPTTLLAAGEDTTLDVEIKPRSLGHLSTALVLTFPQFKMVCTLRASVVDDTVRDMEPTQAYRSAHRMRSTIVPSYQERVKARALPGQRPTRFRFLKLPHRLKQYPVSEELRECLLLKEDITFVRPKLDDPLSWEGYHERFSTLLQCLEVTMEEEIRLFDMQSVSMQRCGPFLTLNVPGLAEGRPSLIVGDSVLVCEPGGDGRSQHFEGYIHEVRQSDILVKFADEFHGRYHGEDYDVMFTFNRTPLRRMHHAVDNSGLLGKKVLFPVNPNPLPPLLSHCSTFFNPLLNDRQRSAVARVLAAQCRPAPYILFGPPGTGKTVTIVEAILQVYHISGGSCRVLACAPSNSAADLLADRLLESGHLEQGALIRLNALQRSQPPSSLLLPHCLDTDNADSAVRYRVVVCTCVTAGILYSLGLSVGHFTHVFVDEAGQATEPECLIPLGMLAGSNGQGVLSGDPMQLGPVLHSSVAISYGMGMSLLERMMGRDSYQRDENKFADHGNYDPLLVTKLVENYRSHECLLELYSELFYDGELIPAADSALTHSLCEWEQLPHPQFPMLFLGVLGEDMREGSSPSWFNPVEAVEVVKIVQSLLGGHTPLLTIDEVGIITPYHKQVEKIRLLLRRTGLDDIKVGSVEEFQGQERKAIILSTVRSAPDMIQFDQQHHLGFLRNPKRFNVAISRAQALLVVVGNPNLLSQDTHWSELLQYAVSNSAYHGAPIASATDITSCE